MPAELGGLHVVGTERHESRRIDNQLRGRTARCGLASKRRFPLMLCLPMTFLSTCSQRLLLAGCSVPAAPTLCLQLCRKRLLGVSESFQNPGCYRGRWRADASNMSHHVTGRATQAARATS